MCRIWQFRAIPTGFRTFFATLFDEPFGIRDLVPFELAGLVGFFQHVAQVFIIMLGAGDLERSGQRNCAVLYRFDQALFSLFQQEDDVADIFFRQTRARDDVVDCVIPRQQELDVCQDLQRPVSPPGDVFGQRHDEGVFVSHIHHQSRDVAFAEQAEGIQSTFAADQQIGGRSIGALALRHCDRLLEADGADVFDDLLEDLHVAVPGIQNLDSVDWDECDALGCVSHHGCGFLL